MKHETQVYRYGFENSNHDNDNLWAYSKKATKGPQFVSKEMKHEPQPRHEQSLGVF
jgi:hypothetical protein